MAILLFYCFSNVNKKHTELHNMFFLGQFEDKNTREIGRFWLLGILKIISLNPDV